MNAAQGGKPEGMAAALLEVVRRHFKVGLKTVQRPFGRVALTPTHTHNDRMLPLYTL